jgi:hypothetical protein
MRQGNKDLWIEALVDGNSLGFSKLGAVPYAIEAAHAISSDNATARTRTQKFMCETASPTGGPGTVA